MWLDPVDTLSQLTHAFNHILYLSNDHTRRVKYIEHVESCYLLADDTDDIKTLERDIDEEVEYVLELKPENNNTPKSMPTSFISDIDQQFTQPSNYQTTTDPTILPQPTDYNDFLNTPLHHNIPPPPYPTPRYPYQPIYVLSYMNDYMANYGYNDLNQPENHTQITPKPTTKPTTTHTATTKFTTTPATTTHQHNEFDFAISSSSDVQFGQTSLSHLIYCQAMRLKFIDNIIYNLIL